MASNCQNKDFKEIVHHKILNWHYLCTPLQTYTTYFFLWKTIEDFVDEGFDERMIKNSLLFFGCKCKA